jgi:UDP-N-acetylmuramate-alanine ligase
LPCTDIQPAGFASTFSFRREGQELARVTLNVPGEHNVVNATAVLALAADGGKIALENLNSRRTKADPGTE